ncbi:MAG TPA: Holliday junction resolvase RuvX [Candidatus Scatovivens faecipullorum]|jgi:RNAse H domain protein, YqgF family|nr:Holliday junction resolvase RuvX [Candidatus Scatovivens faecipullorum]
MRILGIDYGDSRVGVAVTDPLGITAQGLETISHKGNDKIVLKRLDEILDKYPCEVIVVGMPFNMDGTKTIRAEVTEKFIHKLKCKYNKIRIETMDERLTTVAAHKTMNFLDVNKNKKREIVDTISAVYILEMYMNKNK